jgi:hypothetical protein
MKKSLIAVILASAAGLTAAMSFASIAIQQNTAFQAKADGSFTTTNNTVTSVLAQHTDDTTVRFHVTLKNNDFDSVADWTGINGTYIDLLNFKDHILVDGNPISSLYAGQNYFKTNGAGSFCIFLTTTAKAAYTWSKITFKAGCQFPNASFTSKATPTTCYSLPYDVVLNSSSGKDSSMHYFSTMGMAYTTNTSIVGVMAQQVDATTRLHIWSSKNDYSSATGWSGVSKSSALNFSSDTASYILINGAAYSSGLSGIHYRTNGDGTFCIILSSYTVTSMTTITFKAGMQFPCYLYDAGEASAYTNGCYTLPCDITLTVDDSTASMPWFHQTAASITNEIMTRTSATCSTYDGTSKASDLNVYWSELVAEYGQMTTAEKNNITDTNYATALARYDFLVKKYSLSNFLSRSITSPVLPFFNNGSEDNGLDMALFAALVGGLVLVSGAFILAKKKHQN